MNRTQRLAALTTRGSHNRQAATLRVAGLTLAALLVSSCSDTGGSEEPATTAEAEAQQARDYERWLKETGREQKVERRLRRQEEIDRVLGEFDDLVQYEGCAVPPDPMAQPPAPNGPVQTTRHCYESGQLRIVVDGDTIRPLYGPDVRLVGIEAPELYPEEQCYAAEARSATIRLLNVGGGAGGHFLLETDALQPMRDKYGRRLRHAFNARRQDIGLLLVRRGYARVFEYGHGFVGRDRFRMAEHRARTAQRGGWAECGWKPFPSIPDPDIESASPQELLNYLYHGM